MNPSISPNYPINNDYLQVDLPLKPNLTSRQERALVIKGRIIKFGLSVGASMQAMGVGRRLLEHGIAFYAYVQYAPTSLFGQYFYAHAADELAMQVLNDLIAGIWLP